MNIREEREMRGEPDPSFWKDKTVLVTGSGGFAGGHLSEYLYNLGASVRCFLREGETPPITGPRSKIVVGDVQDYGSLLKALEGVEIAFHLAAITAISEARANVFSTFATNSLGTLNLLMAAKEKKTKKIVYVSTCQVYGKQESFPITETMLPHPVDIYSASKLAGESLALSFGEMYGMNINISRAFNHYGPRQREGFLIPEVILRLLNGNALEMRNPTATRDFAYVDDIVRGYILMAEKGRASQIYHFCSGIERSVQEIVDTIVRLSGFKPEVRRTSEAPPVDILRSAGDYSKAKKEMGWVPQVAFEDGIKRTLDWYRTNKGD